MAITITKPTIGGNEDTWGSTINTALDTIVNSVNGTSGTVAPDLSTLTINGTDVTSTAEEINKLDGFTGTFEDLNYAKDLRATTVTSTQFGHLSGVTSNIQTQFDNLTTVNNSTITISAGQGLSGTANFTTNQSSNEIITLALLADQRLADTLDVTVGNNDEYITFDKDDEAIKFRTGGTIEMMLENDGDLHVDGNVTAYSTAVSDQRLKHDIQKIDNALDKVSQINGYTFTYNKDNRKSAGVVAQEIEQVLPSAVNNQKLVFHGQEGIEYKTVQYDQLHGLLIEAIKELKAEIEELKNGSTD